MVGRCTVQTEDDCGHRHGKRLDGLSDHKWLWPSKPINEDDRIGRAEEANNANQS